MILEARITPTAIEQARTRIRAEFLNSRQVEHPALSRAVRARVLCKIETCNAVGSFKGRGSDSFVNALPADTRTLVVASAGNFGLAMANAAERRGIDLTVYAAETASPLKLERIRASGGKVVLSGQDFDEAKMHARADAERMNALYVEDGREAAITAGAGTMAMEICSGSDLIDTLLAPLGNGALLAGIGCWFRYRSPGTRIIGVCAEGAPAMEQSWRARVLHSTTRSDTIADGIAVRVPVPEALADLEGVVDDIVLVNDDAIKRALALVDTHLNLMAEPSGVVGIAALISHPELAKGTICTPITGGNVIADQWRAWLAEVRKP